MNEELKKSLTDLIDETLQELEELKKSRYAAVEVEIKGPGEGIADKPTNGELDAKKADDETKVDEEEDEEEKKKKEEEAKKAEACKAEGKNEEAAGVKVPDGSGACGVNEQAAKAEKSPEQVDKEMREVVVHKSNEEMETLMKSLVDERVKPLEDKLAIILDIVNKIADQPVAPKGTTARAVPLMKSADESTESLSKSEVAAKLFELKKSGTKVDSLDITRAEMGHDLQKIIEKYKI